MINLFWFCIFGFLADLLYYAAGVMKESVDWKSLGSKLDEVCLAVGKENKRLKI